jgi:hypothetical protein
MWLDESHLPTVNAILEEAHAVQHRIHATPSEASVPSAVGERGQVGDSTVSEEVPAAEDNDDNDDDDAEPEFFWPNVQRYIEGASPGRTSVKCGICLRDCFTRASAPRDRDTGGSPSRCWTAAMSLAISAGGNMAITAIRARQEPHQAPFVRLSRSVGTGRIISGKLQRVIEWKGEPSID